MYFKNDEKKTRYAQRNVYNILYVKKEFVIGKPMLRSDVPMP